MTRREFLGLLAKGVGAGLCAPILGSCKRSVLDAKLPFPGEIVGEDLGRCHALRDGEIRADPVEPEPRLYDVIVVGAGISGLAAAWKLVRGGVRNLLVIDKADQVGGTCIAGESNGIVFPWGAHYVESPHPRAKHLLEIYEDLGIITGYDEDAWPTINPRFIVPSPEASVRAGNKWALSRFPIQIATSQDVVEYETFRQDLYRWVRWRDDEGRPAFGCPNEYTSPAEEVRRLDDLSMLEYLESKGLRSEVLQWHVDDRLKDEYGCHIQDVSAWAGIQFWAQSNSGFSDFEPPGTPAPSPLSWPEGNAFLARGLAKPLSDEQLRLRTLVINVRNEKDRVLVTGLGPEARTRCTLQAKSVIYTTPKNAVYHVVPELEAAGRREFRKCRYVPWLVAAVHLREPPDAKSRPLTYEVIGYQAWAVGYLDCRHVAGAPDRIGRPTILAFYAPLCADIEAERQELFREGWEFWARMITNTLEQIHPGVTRLITRLDICRWGHAMVTMTPGFLWGPDRPLMNRPQGRIQFAGSDVSGTPVFEQATYRGIETAQAVMDDLGVSYRSSI